MGSRFVPRPGRDLSMLLFEPPPSQGDLHFRVLGIPVRVHPFFWVGAVILGISGRDGTPPADLIIWIAVVLVSILVHELGHALTQRRFGGTPWITLHSFGGLASCSDCDRSPRSQILISLAGPAAGFALAAVVVAFLAALGRFKGFELSFIPVTWELFDLGYAREHQRLSPRDLVVWDLLQVNILWGLINLLPIYPLDGGQVTREVCSLSNPRQGIITSLRISTAAGVAMAVVGLVAMGSVFTALMFGYLAYTSYRALQAYQSHQPSGW